MLSNILIIIYCFSSILILGFLSFKLASKHKFRALLIIPILCAIILFEFYFINANSILLTTINTILLAVFMFILMMKFGKIIAKKKY